MAKCNNDISELSPYESAIDLNDDRQKIENSSELNGEKLDVKLAATIIEQVQFYFSNENILKDAFLLKHVRRNKEGFVSLKLISSFKRIRQITKDWCVVSKAIQQQSETQSVGLELNEHKTKVRRTEALPAFDETVPSRTIIATNLPIDKLSIEYISELFAECGEISFIRILRPGGTITSDVRQYFNKKPELYKLHCALIEFTESAGARNAHTIHDIQIFDIAMNNTNVRNKTKLAPNNIESIVTRSPMSYMKDIERNSGGFQLKSRRSSLCTDLIRNDKTKSVFRRNSYGNVINIPNTDFHIDQLNKTFCNCSIGSEGEFKHKYTNINHAQTKFPSRRFSHGSLFNNTFEHRNSNCSEYCRCYLRNRESWRHQTHMLPNHPIMCKEKNKIGPYSRRNTLDVNSIVLPGPLVAAEKDNLIVNTPGEHYTGSMPHGTDIIILNKKIVMPAESCVRTPIGPDGSKGFSTRARKIGETDFIRINSNHYKIPMLER